MENKQEFLKKLKALIEKNWYYEFYEYSMSDDDDNDITVETIEVEDLREEYCSDEVARFEANCALVHRDKDCINISDEELNAIIGEIGYTVIFNDNFYYFLKK